jgi:phage-related protein
MKLTVFRIVSRKPSPRCHTERKHVLWTLPFPLTQFQLICIIILCFHHTRINIFGGLCLYVNSGVGVCFLLTEWEENIKKSQPLKGFLERSQGINSLAQWARYMILTTPIHNEVFRRTCAIWHLFFTVAYTCYACK